MSPVELIGFAPDIDPSTPGIFQDCTNIEPRVDGFAASPRLAATPTDALPGVLGGAVTFSLDGTSRMFAGTETALYERAGATWVDKSAVGGYSGGLETRWQFVAFGDAVYATNGVNTIQKITAANFANVATAPKAAILVSASGFLLAFDTDDGINGHRPHGWACSDIRNGDLWTPSASSQAAEGILIDTPGQIMAGKALGDQCIVYKERSMYLGQYIGPPVYWAWTVIPGGERIGAVGKNAVADIGIGHVFVGSEDIYYYDGVRPVSIGGGVKEWFFSRLMPGKKFDVQLTVDFNRSVVRIHFPSSDGDGAIDDALLWNFKTRRWGRARYGIKATMDYISSAMTYDEFSDTYVTYDNWPAVSWDSPFWLPGAVTSAAFGLDNKLATFNGGGMDSNILFGEIGDDFYYSLLSRARIHFVKRPLTGVAQFFGKELSGDDMEFGESSVLDDARFDAYQEWRWHAMSAQFTGDMVANRISYELKRQGDE